ncbi:hypothetical protein HK098_000302 [Nowakowskiella sp. JEL0407]|nr:hypothetical protein HK098_000302 [Nowakowskiella sp. JEL0407]
MESSKLERLMMERLGLSTINMVSNVKRKADNIDDLEIPKDSTLTKKKKNIPSGRIVEDLRDDDFEDGLESGPDEESDEYSDDMSSDEDGASDIESMQMLDNSKKEPEVVVFSEGPKVEDLMFSKREKRRFMSSKLKDMLDTKKPVSSKEKAQDDEDDKHDRELMDLLKVTKLVEQFTADDLTGNDRRNYMKRKVQELGGKAPKAPKASLSMAIGLRKAELERGKKRLQEAKDLGNYHSSLKHKFRDALSKQEKDDSRKKFKRSQRDRVDLVDSGGIGKFKGGVLRVSKKDIKTMDTRASNRTGPSKKLLGTLDGAGRKVGKGAKVKKGKKWK